MADFTLEAQSRTLTGKKVQQLRNQGLIPAVIYGPKTEPVSVQIPYRPLEVTLMHAGGTNLIDIKVENKTHTVLTREVQRHILRGDIEHVDFFAPDMTQPITAEVFLNFVGESPAAAAGKGVLITGPSSLSVESLPAKLPNEIQIDISGLAEIGDSIYVNDLDLGEGITILNDPEELLARITVSSAARAAESEESDADGDDVDADAVGRVGDNEEAGEDE